MPRYSPALVGSLAVICAYMFARNCIYHFLPASTLETWFVRDTWMTVPRLAAFAALLLVNRGWNVAAFELRARDWPKLRLRGLSLGWLALIHGVTDACFFFFPSNNPAPFGFYGLVLQGGLLIYAIVTFPRRAKATPLASVEPGIQKLK